MSTAVVGVDGSVNALAALAWAAQVVGESGTLHVVTAGPAEEARAQLERRWLEPLGLPRPQTSLHFTARDPAESIMEFARTAHADLIAIGTHAGASKLPRAVGSVVHKVLRLTPSPVAVVSEGPPPLDRSAGSVLVGVGNGEATAAAVQWAARFAAERSLPIQLLRAVDLHPLFGLDDAIEVMASYLDPRQLTKWAEEELDLLAKAIIDAGTDVQTTVRGGSVGPCIVEASADASVVVMGKHYDGPITGYFTGRGLHHVLTHARCPIIVVPRAAD